MRLYLVRHAEASYDAPSDEQRPLTVDGAERTRTAARVIKRLGVSPVRIFSSPRVRAIQTAEIIAERLDMDIEVRNEVDFQFSPAGIRRLIQNISEDDDVMFVGHNPSMSEVVNALTGAEVGMKKGGLARLDVINRHTLDSELVWLIAPKVFDALDG